MDNQVKDTVLVVDDDGANLMLAQKILGKDYRMAAANSGANALRYLEKNQPDLILMDIKMPEMDGFQAVAQLKVDARYRAIPVIFLTADKDSETEKRCFQAGAVDFVTKPFIPDILLSRVARTLELAHYQKNLEQIVAEQTRQLEERARRISEMQDSVILGMANLIENRDNSTGRHVKNTQAYVKMIVERLQRERCFPELDGNAAADIVKAAPLHDIGKIRIPDSILQKPGRLTDDEYTAMKRHTEFGAEIIGDIISDVEEASYIKTAEQIALCHHERWDGKGYPHGLSGSDIPLGARIMAVADVFDALYSERCYKEPIRPVERTARILLEGRGTQFDAQVLDAFIELLPEVKRFLSEGG